MKCEGWNRKCDADDAVKYRMKTQYEDRERNYAVLCPFCQKECDEHWQEMWKEYYGSRV